LATQKHYMKKADATTGAAAPAGTTDADKPLKKD
jgi:hypothetical protein